MVSIVVADMLLNGYRKRRDKPKIVIAPSVSGDENGLVIMAIVRNLGKTPLLDTANKVVVYAPRLVVEGKLAHILDGDAEVKQLKWNELREDEAHADWEEDLYPFPPDALFLPLGGDVQGRKWYSHRILESRNPSYLSFTILDLLALEEPFRAHQRPSYRVPYLDKR